MARCGFRLDTTFRSTLPILELQRLVHRRPLVLAQRNFRCACASPSSHSQKEKPSGMSSEETQFSRPAQSPASPSAPNQPSKLTEEEQQKEIQKAREPHNGKQGTVPPSQEKEGYVADLDE